MAEKIVASFILNPNKKVLVPIDKVEYVEITTEAHYYRISPKIARDGSVDYDLDECDRDVIEVIEQVVRFDNEDEVQVPWYELANYMVVVLDTGELIIGKKVKEFLTEEEVEKMVRGE